MNRGKRAPLVLDMILNYLTFNTLILHSFEIGLLRSLGIARVCPQLQFTDMRKNCPWSISQKVFFNIESNAGYNLLIEVMSHTLRMSNWYKLGCF